MVYLQQLMNAKAAKSLFLACLALGAIISEAESTKIVYKKSIDGKTNVIRTKPKKHKSIDYDEAIISFTIPTKLTTTETTTMISTTTTLRPTDTAIHEHLEVAESAPEIHAIINNDLKEESSKESNATHTSQQLETILSSEIQTTIATIDSKEMEKENDATLEVPENHIEIEPVEQVEMIAVEHTPVEKSLNEDPLETKPTTESININTTPSKGPTPCTCGVFMTSQVKRSKNPYEPPQGSPVITNELDRIFPCNAIGQKQCQTKCLEVIVQHLPNSANILCATLDRDIRKERAYLYIKNCRNQWFNTNLTAGREYCCKNGQPYQCPLV